MTNSEIDEYLGYPKHEQVADKKSKRMEREELVRPPILEMKVTIYERSTESM